MKTLIIFIIVGFAISAEGRFYTSATNKTYYMGAADSSSWYEAYVECGFRNMSLLTLENNEKLDDVHQILVNEKIFTPTQTIRVWIGAIGNDRRFFWISNGSPLLSTRWGPGNPSNSGGVENCVEILDRTINDVTCTRKSGYVCEQRHQSPVYRDSVAKYNNFTLNFYGGK